MLITYEELKSWQGAIGSVLGFLALMIAALWNFHLNRKRDAALRLEESHSVAAALYGEIVLLQREVAETAVAVASYTIARGVDGRFPFKIDEHFLARHPLSEPIFYRALASKIGILSSDLVVAISEFHGNFQRVRTSLPLLVENEDRKYSYSASSVLVPARDAVNRIVPALRKIEQMTGISTPSESPSLGKVESLIEMEAIQSEE